MSEDTITPRTEITEGEYNEDVRRQVRSIVTIDTGALDAVMEVVNACDAECDQCDGGEVDQHDGTNVRCEACGGTGLALSEAAREFCDDHGIEDVDDYSIGDYLEGAILDWRAVVNSNDEVVEFQLLTGFGGPNVWEHVDAEGNARIEVYWWGTRGTGTGRHDLYAAIFEYMSEMRACR